MSWLARERQKVTSPCRETTGYEHLELDASASRPWLAEAAVQGYLAHKKQAALGQLARRASLSCGAGVPRP